MISGEQQRKKYEAKNIFTSEKEHTITENTVRIDDLSNKFDFPMINEEMGFVPVKKNDKPEDQDAGWKDSGMFLYKRSDFTNKELNTFFPTLGVVT
jgi:hypothetical protein